MKQYCYLLSDLDAKTLKEQGDGDFDQLNGYLRRRAVDAYWQKVQTCTPEPYLLNAFQHPQLASDARHSTLSEHHSQFTTDAMQKHSQRTLRSVHYRCNAAAFSVNTTVTSLQMHPNTRSLQVVHVAAPSANTTVSPLHIQCHSILSDDYSQVTIDAMQAGVQSCTPRDQCAVC